MLKQRIDISNSNVLIMGLAFKENCPDIRNTRVMDLVENLENLKCKVDVYDPWVDKDEAFNEYGIKLIDAPNKGKYDLILLAVAHNEFKKLSISEIRSLGKKKHILYDIKYLLESKQVDGRL
jgi:UDP-N-acetyl-D-galactosamine dehydrogenase